MKADIWMPLYVADYVADTPYLTTEQHGAYLLLLMAYWRNGPPPDNDAILSSLVKMTPDAWGIARAVLERYFEVCDGYWMHKRVEKEIEKAKQNRTTAHEKAAKAAKARWDKEKERKMLEALPEHMPEKCPSPSPSPSHTKPAKQTEQQSATPPDADAPSKSPKKKKAEWVTAEHMVSTLAGLTEPVATGYLEFRRSKGAALTNLAWGSIAAEVLKSGMAPDVALPYAMNRGWQGFDASWIKPATPTSNGKQSKHDLSTMDYDKGVAADGRF